MAWDWIHPESTITLVVREGERRDEFGKLRKSSSVSLAWGSQQHKEEEPGRTWLETMITP